jgi:NAD+ diphosphatase
VAWIAERLADAATLLVPMWRDRSFIERESANVFVSHSPTLVDRAAHFVFLGLRSDVAVFAVDLSDHAEDEAASLVGRELIDLRAAVAEVDAPSASLLAYARALMHWHRTHRFCGRCGAPTEVRRGGHQRTCTNGECGLDAFPVTSPAVIMLVERRVGDERYCLLARHSRLVPGMYSTLAGFVEPGESLEEAVARETFEETGVRVGAVTYQGSQPWPFPSSIMLGFRAEALSSEIVLDREELEEGRWFSAAEVREFGEWGDADAARKVPRRDSIARFLIDSWLAEG